MSNKKDRERTYNLQIFVPLQSGFLRENEKLSRWYIAL